MVTRTPEGVSPEIDDSVEKVDGRIIIRNPGPLSAHDDNGEWEAHFSRFRESLMAATGFSSERLHNSSLEVIRETAEANGAIWLEFGQELEGIVE